MKKVLFATENESKVKRFKNGLLEKNIEIISLNNIDTKVEVIENGKNAIENAYIKAKTYYDATKIPTIGMDNNLFIEDLPEEKQPGTYVRRVNGKELNDEEMIEHYTKLVKENGGNLKAKWVYGMVVCSDKGTAQFSWTKDHFYFVDKPCEKINRGYPLDSISIIPEFNKYLAELTDKEKEEYKKKDNIEEVAKFVVENC